MIPEKRRKKKKKNSRVKTHRRSVFCIDCYQLRYNNMILHNKIEINIFYSKKKKERNKFFFWCIIYSNVPKM
jgi:hypothetical protein